MSPPPHKPSWADSEGATPSVSEAAKAKGFMLAIKKLILRDRSMIAISIETK
jgi:hypothetical protein